MPTNTSFTIKDGVGNVVLTLDSTLEKGGSTTRKYINRAAATPLAAESLSFTWRGGGNSETGAASCAISLELPSVLAATATTPTTVSHVNRFTNGKAYMANRATAAECTRLAIMTKNVLSHPDVQNMIILREPLRG